MNLFLNKITTAAADKRSCHHGVVVTVVAGEYCVGSLEKMGGDRTRGRIIERLRLQYIAHYTLH
jgi:hypothetical protein